MIFVASCGLSINKRGILRVTPPSEDKEKIEATVGVYEVIDDLVLELVDNTFNSSYVYPNADVSSWFIPSSKYKMEVKSATVKYVEEDSTPTSSSEKNIVKVGVTLILNPKVAASDENPVSIRISIPEIDKGKKTWTISNKTVTADTKLSIVISEKTEDPSTPTPDPTPDPGTGTDLDPNPDPDPTPTPDPDEPTVTTPIVSIQEIINEKTPIGVPSYFKMSLKLNIIETKYKYQFLKQDGITDLKFDIMGLEKFDSDDGTKKATLSVVYTEVNANRDIMTLEMCFTPYKANENVDLTFKIKKDACYYQNEWCSFIEGYSDDMEIKGQITLSAGNYLYIDNNTSAYH